jgi:Tetratricopeptide repeat.
MGQIHGELSTIPGVGKGKSEKMSAAWHNIGNSLLQKKELEKSMEAYKMALRMNPEDEETRYNLAVVQKMIQDQQQDQQQEQQQQQNQDQQQQEPQKQPGSTEKAGRAARARTNVARQCTSAIAGY